MSDEQKKDESTAEEAPVQEEDAQSAGPVADEDSSSSQAAGEEPSSAPPAEDAPAADAADTAAEEGASSDDAPAAEADQAPGGDAGSSEAEASEEDGLPWKVRRRLEKSRRPHTAGPQQNPEERAAARKDARARKAAERRKERAAAKAAKQAGAGTPRAEHESNAAKVRQGIVVSNKGDKSITVRIDIARRHPTYEKVVRRSRTLHAHDERNEAGEGDVVRVVETKPLSKTKRWRLVDVVEKAR
jgi:small subunit ribosomal protein S17